MWVLHNSKQKHAYARHFMSCTQALLENNTQYGLWLIVAEILGTCKTTMNIMRFELIVCPVGGSRWNYRAQWLPRRMANFAWWIFVSRSRSWWVSACGLYINYMHYRVKPMPKFSLIASHLFGLKMTHEKSSRTSDLDVERWAVVTTAHFFSKSHTSPHALGSGRSADTFSVLSSDVF